MGWNIRRVLITGGAGFIGSNLSETLLKKNIELVIVDNFNDYYDPHYKEENLQEVEYIAKKYGTQLFVCRGDICDTNFINQVFMMYKPDMVVHLAAYAGVRHSIEKPALYMKVNVDGTINLLEAMKKYQVNRLVFASSSSVYGNNKSIPFCEEDSVDAPPSPYAASKKAGELICYTYHKLYHINTACLRFFTVYGKRQRPDLAIYKFTKKILNGQEIQFYGDGQTKRDYTYIDDIIDGILKAMDWIDSKELRYQVFNLGESNMISLSDMLKTIEHCTNKKAIVQYLPERPGDVKLTYADINKAKTVLGYEPKMRFEEGINNFVEWFKSYRMERLLIKDGQ